MVNPLVINIEKDTIDNNYYRKVIFTGENLQVVLMSLNPGIDIPEEVHSGDQFIRVEAGSGQVSLDGKIYIVKDGSAIHIPAGTRHRVRNTGTSKLKLYSIYSPPEHPDNLIQEEKN